MTFNQFLKEHCLAAGGNLTAMLMSGIRHAAPEVTAIMPDRSYAFDEVTFIVAHLCTDLPHHHIHVSCETDQAIIYGERGFIFRPATEEDKTEYDKQQEKIKGDK